jgi:hypothetical protein
LRTAGELVLQVERELTERAEESEQRKRALDRARFTARDRCKHKRARGGLKEEGAAGRGDEGKPSACAWDGKARRRDGSSNQPGTYRSVPRGSCVQSQPFWKPHGRLLRLPRPSPVRESKRSSNVGNAESSDRAAQVDMARMPCTNERGLWEDPPSSKGRGETGFGGGRVPARQPAHRSVRSQL